MVYIVINHTAILWRTCLICGNSFSKYESVTDYERFYEQKFLSSLQNVAKAVWHSPEGRHSVRARWSHREHTPRLRVCALTQPYSILCLVVLAGRTPAQTVALTFTFSGYVYLHASA